MRIQSEFEKILQVYGLRERNWDLPRKDPSYNRHEMLPNHQWGLEAHKENHFTQPICLLLTNKCLLFFQVLQKVHEWKEDCKGIRPTQRVLVQPTSPKPNNTRKGLVPLPFYHHNYYHLNCLDLKGGCCTETYLPHQQSIKRVEIRYLSMELLEQVIYCLRE